MCNKNIVSVLSLALLALIIFAALGPAKLVPRTGLGWQLDHFSGYFVFTSLFCCVWRRCFTVGFGLTSFAVALEICQGLTPDRAPDVMGAFYSTSGIFTATLLAELAIRSRRQFLHGSYMRVPF